MNRATTSIFMLVLMFDLENAAMLNSTKSNEEQCKDGWSFFEGKCYKLFHKEKYFVTSRQECKQNEGDLVSIRSEKENDFISKLIAVSQHSEAWIGFKLIKGEFRWVDDTPLSFHRWMSNKPSKDGDCTEMIAGGEWVNILCYHKQAFVCKKEPNPIASDSNLRLILTITISVSCIFIMFVFVAFLCVKSHKELEAVESQTKETIPFEIVKAAMVLPMSKPPDLLDHNKVKNTWQGTIKSISKHTSDRNLQTISAYSVDEENQGAKKEVVSVEINNDMKRDDSDCRIQSNSVTCLNQKSTSNHSSPKLESEAHLEKSDVNDIDNDPKIVLRSSPSYASGDAIPLERPASGETNYITKVDKWLKESPESPTRRHRVRESSVRRKHFQQSRNSQKGRAIPETPELELDYSFDDDEAKTLDNNNTIRDFKPKKPIQRQNVITVTADINMTRNNSSDIETPYSTSAAPSMASDNENGRSPSLSNGKRRKRPVFAQPDEIVNENFLFLKTLNYSQETEYSDLSDQRSEDKVDDRKFADDEKPDQIKPDDPDPNLSKLKEEYQLVTFV